MEPVSSTGNELEVEEQRNDLPPGEIIGLEFMESEQIEDMPDEKMEEDFERSRDEREVCKDDFYQSCLLLAEFSFSHNTVVVWNKSNGSGTTTPNSETTQSML